ncbi:alpha/beta hydrolase [Lujinxingia litoralis]|uniref:Alpha/beta hydrolase n=2 Tax=Lujinxingia litoralis TaxID=2211119 RepID=A0A328C5B0_9DELT|nr:alpha/beta hydrolase [Lujinxingia litoralis]
MASSAVFDRFLPHLDASRFRIIVVDHRGAGASSPCASYTINDYVEDLKAVLDHADVSSVDLLGHSMGGLISQVFAARYPERIKKLALVCAVPATGMELPPEAHDLFLSAGQNREKLAAILGMATLELSEDAAEVMLDDAMTIPAECIKASYLAWTGGGFEDELASIQAPTLVVGTDDPFLPPDFLKAVMVEPIANASFAYLPGPGHYPQVERSAELAAIINAFF